MYGVFCLVSRKESGKGKEKKENSLMREEGNFIYSDLQFFICVKVAKLT